MRRRDAITLLGGAAAWPLTAHAQQPARIPRIGYLGLGPAAQDIRVDGLRAGLRDLGYIEGKDIIMEFRWAEKVEQLSQFASEMVLMNVSVIFAPSSTQVEAARQATKTIPILFATHADPVGVGHVASLRQPGGNITGLSELLTELAVKELEILKEAVPQATGIGVLWNPTTPSHPVALKAVAAAGEKLGIALHQEAIQTFADFDGAFATMTRERVDGFLDLSSPLTLFGRTTLAELALKHRLPGMFGRRANVEAGGLMSYGADQVDLFRRAAAYIDKILKGVKPADLPVEQASKYELIVNLRTARVLGLDVPPMLLARAAEVIE
jgi:putative ABC transport system substrate-binding protein